jgi:hypothetical protein
MVEFRDITRAAASIETAGANPDLVEMTFADMVSILPPFIRQSGTPTMIAGMRVRLAERNRVGYFTKEALGPLSPRSWYIRNHGETRRSWIDIDHEDTGEKPKEPAGG